MSLRQSSTKARAGELRYHPQTQRYQVSVVVGEEKERGGAAGTPIADDLEVDDGGRAGAEGLPLLGANLAKRIRVEFLFRHSVKKSSRGKLTR